MNILRASGLYFALAFGAGFILGVLRVLWLVPMVGTRTAELIEAPIMLVVIVFASRWVCRRLAVPPDVTTRLGMGLLALLQLVAVEFTVVLWLRGLTLGDYFASRDPVAGGVYAAMLLGFAAMPLLIRRI